MKPNFLLALMAMMRPMHLEPSKKQATKKGFGHKKKEIRKLNHIRHVSQTNNERVVAGRAKKLGITSEVYRLLFPKGYSNHEEALSFNSWRSEWRRYRNLNRSAVLSK